MYNSQCRSYLLHQEIVEALTCLVRVDHVAALRDIGFNV